MACMDQKKEQGFIPISQAWTPKIRFDVNFPTYVNKEEIGVNLGRINLLRYLGGISHLRLVSVSGEENKEEHPQIIGFSSNGEAYAGKTRTSTTTTSSSTDSGLNRERSSGGFVLPERWVDGIVKIDMKAATNKINSNRNWRKGTRDPEAWASIVDESLRKGINEIGVKHLIFGGNLNDKLQILLAACFSIANAAKAGSTEPHMPTLEGFVSDMAVRLVILNGVFFIMNIPKRMFGNEGYRPSFLLVAQPEYVLALRILSQRRLAKKLESDT